MTEPVEVHEAGALLVAARRAGRPAPVPDWAPASVAEAWAAQDWVAAAFGPVGGWKVGPGEPKVLAPIFARDVWPEGARVEIASSDGLALEVEVGFRLARDLAPGEALDEAGAAALIGSAHVAVEVCAVRLQDGHRAPSLWKLADNQANEALVIGPALADWRGRDWAALTASLALDGSEVVARRGGHPTGDPVRLCMDALPLIARRGGAPAGTPIITGTWTGMHFLAPPARVEAAIEGLGRIAFDLARH